MKDVDATVDEHGLPREISEVVVTGPEHEDLEAKDETLHDDVPYSPPRFVDASQLPTVYQVCEWREESWDSVLNDIP